MMRRIVNRCGAALVTGLLATGLAGAGLAGLEGTAQAQVAATSPARAVAPATTWSLSSAFARETVRRGARDTSVRHIAHVREVQLRLKHAGLYTAAIDGSFGRATEAAVKTFQQHNHLTANGVVGPATWTALIRRTTHLAVPATCRHSGWHMCVDRFHHEASLFHNGALYNSWLVRTGASNLPTRVGTHSVYWRDINHVSHQYGGKMPYAQFFDGGEALHGSVLMMNPYVGHSHGCVNFWLEDARQLWNLTHDKHLVVTVYGAWN